ncbi:stimulator of interferon genes protein-like [Saccostrea cucullata]|uniref:stimulator of interferon genes protein-like n=1 Tax=Saccostrea cuccullata TaxID=36930 RepID=UPI002ED30F4C
MEKDSKSHSLYERNPKTETDNVQENIDTEDLSHSGLPPDKSYHTFIAYSSDDRHQAVKICKELESRFFLKCVFSDRDFIPGTPTIDNIRNFMERSDTVLFILSPNFLRSSWCITEVQIALEMSLRILPLILYSLNTNDLPPALKPYTCIDARGKHDITAEIHEALYHMGVVDANNEAELGE